MGAPADAVVQGAAAPVPVLGRPRQALFWVVFFACCGLLGYTYLLVLGAPGWMPDAVHRLLAHLPGV